MNYVLADTKKAVAAGFSDAIHSQMRGGMVLTEKEVEQSPLLSGSTEERLKTIGGSIVSLNYLSGGGRLS